LAGKNEKISTGKGALGVLGGDFGLIQLRIADLKKRQMSVSILDLKGRLRFSILQLYDI
jgi:hypothetical protein